MRTTNIFSFSVCFAVLVGCTDPTNESTAKFIGDVQNATKNACNIIPTAKTIISLVSIIFPKAVPAGAALQTAEEICTEFEGKPGEPSPIIEGDFVSFEVRGTQIDAFVLD